MNEDTAKIAALVIAAIAVAVLLWPLSGANSVCSGSALFPESTIDMARYDGICADTAAPRRVIGGVAAVAAVGVWVMRDAVGDLDLT